MATAPPKDQLHDDWNGQLDTERAVANATIYLDAVYEGRIDPTHDRDHLRLAADAVADGADDPQRVLRAVKEAERAVRMAERFDVRSELDRAELIGWYTAERAIAHHRADDPLYGLTWSLSSLTIAENLAGSWTALLDAVGSQTPNPAAKIAIGAMGVFPASLRRARLGKESYEKWSGWGRDLVSAYLLSGHKPVVYPRTAALTAQWLFKLVHEAKPEDGPLIHALWALDVEERPVHPRGQATKMLAAFEYARYCGDHAHAEIARETAAADIASFPLVRHARVIDQHGYLAA